jgi:hypothetical protein
LLVSVDRTGGYAGIGQAVGTLDTADLGSGPTRAVLQAVADIAAAGPDEVGADRSGYQVTVEDEEGARAYFLAENQPGVAQPSVAQRGLDVLLRYLETPTGH